MGTLDELYGKQPQQSGSTLKASGENKGGALASLYAPPASTVEQAESEFDPTPKKSAGEFSLSESLERGLINTWANTLEAFGEVEGADRWRRSAPEASIPNFRQIDGAGTTGQFIAERTAESSPGILASVAGTGVGFLLGGPIGAGIGFTATTGIPLLGESKSAIREEGGEGTTLEALPAATANTALEAVPVAKVAKLLGLNKVLKKSADEVIDAAENAEQVGLFQKALKATGETGKMALTEGSVEAMQELNNKMAARFFSDKEVLALGDEDFEQLLQAFAGGAAGGTGMGVTAQGVGASIDKINEIRKEREARKLKESVSGVLQEEIKKRKVKLEEAEDLIARQGEKLDKENPFSVFKGLEGISVEHERGPLPVGKSGFGPNYLSNYENTYYADTIKAVEVEAEVDGETVNIPLSKGKNGRAHIITPKDKSALGFADGELSRHDLLKEIQGVYNDILGKLGLKMDVVVGDLADVNKALGVKKSNVAGYMMANKEGNVIALDLDGALVRSPEMDIGKGDIFETAIHELGHAIIKQQWFEMDGKTQDALIQGYREWLTETENMTGEEFTKAYRDAGNVPIIPFEFGKERPFRQTLADMDERERGYYLSFDEYAAQQMVKAVNGKLSSFKTTQERDFWRKMAEAFKKFWDALEARFRTEKTFEAWVDSMLLRKEIAELTAIELEMRNPTGERKDAEARIKTFIEEETEAGKKTKVESVPTEDGDSALADALERLGLSHIAEDMRRHQDVILGFQKLSYVLTPIQMAELAEKTGIQNPARYMELVREYSNTKMNQVVIADEIVQKWKSLGKERSVKLGNFLFEVSTLSDEKNRRLRLDEVDEMAADARLDEATYNMWKEIDGSFRQVLSNVERGLILDAAKSFIKDAKKAREFRDLYLEAANDRGRQFDLIEEYTGMGLIPEEGDRVSNPLHVELERIKKSVGQLKNRNYFPRTRLGEYTITIKATEKDQEWEGHTSSVKGQTLGFYAYDSKKERDQQLKAMKQEAVDAGLSISGSVMDSEVFAMMGMPEVLIQQLAGDPKMDLSDEQKEQLKNISLNLSPGKRFLRHLKRRRGIDGFSQDALRVYSTYMMSAANHLARVEHAKSMVEELNTFNNDIRELELSNLGGDIGDLVKLKNYFQRHFDYLMKPDNDLAQLRSIGFLWYLGFNIKSAIVNFTQTPMVTFPVLAGRFGNSKAFRALGKALKDTARRVRNNDGLRDDELAMLQELRDTGILDESMVMELAGMGEADILQRTIPGWKLDTVLNKLSYYGGAMFRIAEKFNRNATALAAYRLARDSGMPEPVRYAREAIEKTQFEYAKWNRAEFMRGKKSVIFLFWQYMQHASYLFFGGDGKKTAIRMWLLALFVAGVEGLPFAKTILNLINLGGKEVKEAMGVADPRMKLEEDMRELLLEITDKPDLVLNGMASYWGLGPLHLLSLTGAPVPEVDISGSLSFGSPVGFLDEALTGSGSPDQELGKLTASILGPVGGMMLQGYKSWNSTDPDEWKNIERALPVFMKNAMQGARWLDEGQETFRGGGEFLNMDKPEHRVSAIAKAMGFQPTRLTQKYKQVMAQQEAAMYWSLRKQMLLTDYAYAVQIGDREARKDANDAIRKHNKNMRQVKELRGLAISSKDLKRSLRAKQREIALRERGLTSQKRQQPLHQSLKELYPVLD